MDDGQALFGESYHGNDVLDLFQYGYSNGYGVYWYIDNGKAAGFFEDGTPGSQYALVAMNDFSHAGASFGTINGVGGDVYSASGGFPFPALVAEEGKAGTPPFVTVNDNGGPGPNDETFVIADTASTSGEAATHGSDVNVSGDLYVTGRVYHAVHDVSGVRKFPMRSRSARNPQDVKRDERCDLQR